MLFVLAVYAVYNAPSWRTFAHFGWRGGPGRAGRSGAASPPNMGCCHSSTASEVPPPSPGSDEPQPLKVPELATTGSAESELLAEPYRRMVLLPRDSGEDLASMDSFSGFGRCCCFLLLSWRGCCFCFVSRHFGQN